MSAADKQESEQEAMSAGPSAAPQQAANQAVSPAAGWDRCDAARQRYQDRLATLQGERDRLKQADRRWNLARTATFLAALALLLLGYVNGVGWMQASGWLSLVAFLVAVTLHQQVRDALEEIRRNRSVVRRLLARLERRWDRLPVWKPDDQWLASSGISADVADDLDLFGRGSLFQLVSVAATGPGLRTLARWLGGPAEGRHAEGRAEAVEALAPLRDQREAFYRLARRAADGTAAPDPFVAWASGPSYLATRRWLLVWARASVLLSLFAGVMAIVTLLTALPLGWPIVGGLLALVVTVNLLITMLQLGPIHDIFAVAISGRGDVAGYAALFTTAHSLPDAPPRLQDIKLQLVGPAGGVHALNRLDKTARQASLRHSGILFIPYLALQLLGLWDVHVLGRLERWQQEYGDQVDAWFVALGSLEALVSLAALRDEYPNWGRATWIASDENAQLTSTQLGHPLLPDDARVPNDVAIGPSGTVLLVTGSNMSGKSTMLRSVGLNVMLAAAGGPVCAQALRLPDVDLSTSIRVRDSVREGVSFYMAELHRLRGVVEHARQLRDHDDRRVLYLLDEILQGTNSRERQIAVARVLGHLVETGAIGAISTHDLDLAEDPLLQQVAQTVHFRETIHRGPDGRDAMTFDYRMRQGVTPTTNALRLLEIVGLGSEQPAAAEDDPQQGS